MERGMRKFYIYMFLSAFCAGSIGVLVKLIGETIPLMTLNFFRMFFAFLFLVATVPFIDKQWYKLDLATLKEYVFVGFLYALAFTLFIAANLHAPVQNVVLIFSSFPFFVLIFGSIILKERVTKLQLLLLGVGIVALAIINPFHRGANMFGNLLALANSIVFAFLVVQMKRESKNHGAGDVLWFMLFGSLFVLPFALHSGLGMLGQSIWYVLILAVVSTGLAYLFYNLALQKIGAETSSIISIIVTPVVAIILAVLILGEGLKMRMVIGGGLLIIAAIYLATHTSDVDSAKKEKQKNLSSERKIKVTKHKKNSKKRS